jgi:hypothetical protein
LRLETERNPLRSSEASACRSNVEWKSFGTFLLRRFGVAPVPFEENGITEFVRTIVARVQLLVHTPESLIVNEGPQ